MSVKDTTTDSDISIEKGGCFGQVNIVSNYQMDEIEHIVNPSQSTSVCSAKSDTALINFVEISNHNKESSDILCLNRSEQFLDSFELNVSNAKGKYKNRTFHELNECSLKQLQVLYEELTKTVEKVSSELVQLLSENDSLQQESDARNIAIEQLLRMTVKEYGSDPQPIQMSVVLPEEECDDV